MRPYSACISAILNWRKIPADLVIRPTLRENAGMGSQAQKTTTYEYPLSERMRTFLRLEFLFDQFRFGAEGETVWHTRSAISGLLDIKELLSRSDVRSELQKELDRMTTSLEALHARPEVDTALLEPVLAECREVAGALRKAPTGMPPIVRDNEFLATIEQRAGVWGGTCAFDLPGYHLWLETPAADRHLVLEQWHSAFKLIDRGISLILRLLRDSADPVTEQAPKGNFQTTLDRATPYQMLRVLLPQGSPYYPEISGSRHYCNIRFLQQPTQGERPQQVESDVQFTLERCLI